MRDNDKVKFTRADFEFLLLTVDEHQATMARWAPADLIEPGHRIKKKIERLLARGAKTIGTTEET